MAENGAYDLVDGVGDGELDQSVTCLRDDVLCVRVVREG
jgi:hypothetical protein